MKKYTVLLLLFSISSCEKSETPPQTSVVQTDLSPFAIDHPEYVFITRADLDEVRIIGKHCFQNPITGETYDCNLWCLVKVPAYWGYYYGRMYISTTKQLYSINASNTELARSIVREHGIALGRRCNTCAKHYPGFEIIDSIKRP